MKNLLLTLITACSFSAYAIFPYDHSSVEIKSYGINFTVAIDKQYFPQPAMDFYIENITPGNHLIEIFGGYHCHHYGNHSAKCKREKMYAGRVYIKPASNIKAVIDPYRGFYISDITPLTNYYHDPYPDHSYDQRAAHIPYAMPAGAFGSLLRTLDDQWTDDSRYAIAMQVLETNSFNSMQIKEILEQFWFEENRVRFAKAAYSRVIDPQYYYVVYDAFWFGSSREEVSAYISKGH
ncbi:MAG: DUF4476 domain-containing protein [Chitinophagales bacterium]|nr:DUF4476 domain-containing protein [Chitinophagales bacterium]